MCNVELKLVVISCCFCGIPEYKSNMFVHFDHTNEYNSSLALALGSKLAACNVELTFYQLLTPVFSSSGSLSEHQPVQTNQIL